jgi:serine phosphatase RsbU (regulator of sigma subunit)
VSGDFYFFAEVSKNGSLFRIIAAADCTGHGVPGAFMSMIGNDLLNQIIHERKITAPAEILTHLHEGVRSALKQNEATAEFETHSRDGMDICLCSFEAGNYELEFAGAQRPLFIVHKNNSGGNGKKFIAEEIKGDKFPVAGTHHGQKRMFTPRTVNLNPGDSIYLYTDGYADQFGGASGKKMMSKKFKELLLSLSGKNMSDQKKVLDDTIQRWKGNRVQVDDILVIGIRM